MVAAFEGDVPEEGRDATEVIDDLAPRAAPGLEGMPSARYFGFVIGGHLDAALAADNLTAAWDQNTTLAAATPAAAACEEVVGRQLASVLGLPAGVSFALVTGGMMANFTALAAARHSVLRAHGWDHEIDGLQGAPRVRLVVGAERHSTIDRSLRYLGFGSSSIEVVEADSQGSMRPESLARVLSAQPKGPTIVCAQAGNVNSGGFDPFARSATSHTSTARGCTSTARSVFGPRPPATIDISSTASSKRTHGRPMRTSGSTCPTTAASRSPRIRPTTPGAFGFRADYLVFSDGRRDPADFTPEASRRARAVRGVGRAAEPRHERSRRPRRSVL